jgi:hypothetical protein
MKKIALLLAACAAALCVSCKKEEVDPERIQFRIDGDGSFARIELAESVDAQLVVSAPRGIDELCISLALGGFNSIANQHIGIEANKGTEKKNAVFDLIKDLKVISYVQGLGVEAGTDLAGAKNVTLDVKKVIMALLEWQPVENDRTFTVSVGVQDKSGSVDNATMNFHYTSAPEITWPKNPAFSVINLDRMGSESGGSDLYKIAVRAPGKIATLVISLDEKTADAELKRWIVNRVTGDQAVISLHDDLFASEKFKYWFPTKTQLVGAEVASLNFVFVSENLPDYTDNETTNVFTITVTDSFGKEAQAQAKFHVPAK